MTPVVVRPPKAVRTAFHVDYAPDTDYSAHARLLQSKWREKHGYPRGKLGNYLEPEFAVKTRANFLTDTIKRIVSAELAASKKDGALIQPARLWGNLLSSQPLCFNLFGELQADLDLASETFREIFPDRIETVTAIKFEYSPGRKSERYTADNSAFDVFIEYDNQGKRGCIGIEVKYAESLREESVAKAASNFRSRYSEIIAHSRLFKADSLDALKRPPVAQMCRDHLLSLVTRQDYQDGFFVFLHPAGNAQCVQGVIEYGQLMVSGDEVVTGFYPVHLESFIDVLCRVCNQEWTRELRERYLGI